jgi:hypothetical protein
MLIRNFAIDDVVVLSADGAEFAREERTVETDHARTDDTAFFAEGIVGVVRDERYDRKTGTKEYAVVFAADPVEGRAWWMCPDEITVKKEAA